MQLFVVVALFILTTSVVTDRSTYFMTGWDLNPGLAFILVDPTYTKNSLKFSCFASIPIMNTYYVSVKITLGRGLQYNYFVRILWVLRPILSRRIKQITDTNFTF